MVDPIQSQVQYFQFCTGRTGLTVGIRDVLFSRRSAFQHVQVFETDVLGKMMTLDGIVMFTEHDEFAYHEMISHPALCLAPRAERVLIVGGGDGGTLREVLRHARVRQVDLVDIDPLVIETSRRFFPALAGGFADLRAAVHLRDGAEFVRESAGDSYDLVIVDGIDPLGIGAVLYSAPFYRECARLLTAEGIFVTLSESPFDPAYRHVVRQVHHDLRAHFLNVATYLAYVPTYQMGMWSFALGSKTLHPVRDFQSARAAELIRPFETQLQYYNPEVHLAAFALPSFVRRLIEQAEPQNDH